MRRGAMSRRRGLARGIWTTLLLLSVTAPVGAQGGDAAPSAAGPAASAPGDLVERVERLRSAEPWLGLPDPAAATTGPRTIAPGTSVAGDVVVVGGTLDVRGTIEGNAAAYGGDVVIHPGGSVRGDAVSVLGRVRLEGGTVGGELRSVRGSLAPAPLVAGRPAATVGGRLGLVAGWLVVLLVLGVGVLFFASGPLAGVTETLQRGFGRALLAGIAGQIALLPALLLVIVALAATLIGILLIPFAVVAFALAAAGLMMLGFLAVARVTGGAFARRDAEAESGRGAGFRALVVGILFFVALWVLAALLTPMPLANAVMRAVAFALSWVAMTAGFGAAILSRAGTRRAASGTAEAAPLPEEELSWQTPTPIGGVAAARRPAPTSSR
ncbi:MAG TPA: hypothetical protein VFX39_10125 [Gemmatimonadaceae bacterium]|nr:hypothetical protein [Gemmatimonadaceae bacterium]